MDMDPNHPSILGQKDTNEHSDGDIVDFNPNHEKCSTCKDTNEHSDGDIVDFNPNHVKCSTCKDICECVKCSNCKVKLQKDDLKANPGKSETKICVQCWDNGMADKSYRYDQEAVYEWGNSRGGSSSDLKTTSTKDTASSRAKSMSTVSYGKEYYVPNLNHGQTLKNEGLEKKGSCSITRAKKSQWTDLHKKKRPEQKVKAKKELSVELTYKKQKKGSAKFHWPKHRITATAVIPPEEQSLEKQSPTKESAIKHPVDIVGPKEKNSEKHPVDTTKSIVKWHPKKPTIDSTLESPEKTPLGLFLFLLFVFVSVVFLLLMQVY